MEPHTQTQRTDLINFTHNQHSKTNQLRVLPKHLKKTEKHTTNSLTSNPTPVSHPILQRNNKPKQESHQGNHELPSTKWTRKKPSFSTDNNQQAHDK